MALTPDYQERDLEELNQDVAGALECWIFSVLIFLEKRGNARASTATHCSWELEDSNFCQTLSTNWQRSIQSELRPVPPDC